MFGLELTHTMLGLAFLAGLVTTLSPCVLPLLPIVAASATGRSRWGLAALALGLIIALATVVMTIFSFAAVIPLALAGLASRQLFFRHRSRMADIGRIGRWVMGIALIVIGALVLTGLDKQMEAALLQIAPEWLLELTTQF